ncbi:MAG: phosphatidylserine/phosphatidylglycerophosphate/cardiolipin synthase family protein [Parachlamydiaceae bacterium]|nr:phosphatidylserine/phosphatidylglycerophosphate/cardiolipin synthase family protein [Parachlamydiaceae bacterium]
MKTVITKILLVIAFAANSDRAFAASFIENIGHTPLIVSNHDVAHNTLSESVYELVNHAETSILLMSFTFSDSSLIKILNQKAIEGVHVHLMIDRDHIGGVQSLLHPSITVGTRQTGEGHLHHKIIVVDRSYIWLGSGNFTPNCLVTTKNLAIAHFNPEIAEKLHEEATHIQSQEQRHGITPLSCYYDNQLLELYILPHNQPESPRVVETQMNEVAKQKMISLFDSAQHHIYVSIDQLTFKDASRALIKARQRGVVIEVVTQHLDQEAVKLLMTEGVNVKAVSKLHHKFALIDNKVLLNGSPNWSMNAFSRSDESFIVLNDLTSEQLAVMNSVWQSISGKQLDLTEFETISIPQTAGDDESEEVAEKQTLVNKTISNLNEAIQNKVILGQEDKRLVDIAKKLSYRLTQFKPYLKSAAVPGCCLYSCDDYLMNVVTIAEKQERVEDAIKQIKVLTGVDKKVSDYFQSTLGKLQQGNNVPIPDFFHATRTGLESILQSRTILQSKSGAAGPGTYMSCNNEGHFGYGPYAFAIDESTLADTQAKFFTGRQPNGDVYFSLWAAVLKDIPIKENSIAYIDTASNDVDRVKDLVKAQNLNIDVMDRSISDSIRRVFDLSTKRRETPSFGWSKLRSDDYLPKNMYLRSEQGTFRQFMPGL